jgi:hypothetical protein
LKNLFFDSYLVDDNHENTPDITKSDLPEALTRREEEVFELLQTLSTPSKAFHEWYRGGITILKSKSPDRIAQAAHSIRELCDALPKRIADIPEFKSPISAVKNFSDQFLDLKAQNYGDGWQGKIVTAQLNDLLSKFEKLFNEPPRSKRFGKALTAFDLQIELLSKDTRRKRDNVFEELVSFFQNVAHHKHLATEEEFRKKLAFFESLLLNYLTPCTETQQKELLALMAGPANPDNFSKINALISHKTANLTFFLEKVENPEWLPILDENGFFKNLPEPD